MASLTTKGNRLCPSPLVSTKGASDMPKRRFFRKLLIRSSKNLKDNADSKTKDKKQKKQRNAVKEEERGGGGDDIVDFMTGFCTRFPLPEVGNDKHQQGNAAGRKKKKKSRKNDSTIKQMKALIDEQHPGKPRKRSISVKLLRRKGGKRKTDNPPLHRAQSTRHHGMCPLGHREEL